MSDNTKDNIVDVSDAARSVPTMLLLLLTRRFPFSVLTLSNLLPLGDVGTLRAASVLFVVLGRCTQRPYHASAFAYSQF